MSSDKMSSDKIEWKVLNNALGKTWYCVGDSLGDEYLNSEQRAKEIMSELKANGMVHRDDLVPYITWDRFDCMSTDSAMRLYNKCLELIEIKKQYYNVEEI